MTRDKGRDPDTSSESADPDAGALASAETRVLVDDSTHDQEAALSDTRIAGSGADSEAATVLVEEDDRTQFVKRPPEAPRAVSPDAAKATRVLDPATPPAESGRAEPEGETRVLDVSEDKTSPPPVSAPEPPQARQNVDPAPDSRPAPTPIDSARGLEPGMILFGEYEIVNVLGVGGMGEVYRARHRRLGEHRAIKVMHAELSKKKGASEFFYREAKALLAVRHPAVVHCHDLLSDDEGRVYLIMEMIEGIPLSKKMNDGPLSPDDVAILGARVSHGLSAAHRKGVIHRDVSPDNIVLPNGRVQEAKIIDFGIAKILQEGEGTIVDGFKGKLSYASPEQLGFFGGKIDGRSDFYSLGLVLVAAALGRPMSMGTTVMEAVDARRGFQTLPDEIPVGLRSAIQPLLALDPKDRPKYVDRLFVVPGGLEGATDPGGYGGSGAVSRGTSERRAKSSRVGLAAGLAAAGTLAAAGGLYLALGREAPSPAPSTSTVEEIPEATESEVVAPIVEVEAPKTKPESEAANAPAVVAKASSPKPAPRRVTASDRIKIIGLLNNAKLALSENRLMSPSSDNAFDRYQRILALDSSNQQARDGLREVAARYLGLADSAAANGELAKARDFLARAKRSDPSHPGIARIESRLNR